MQFACVQTPGTRDPVLTLFAGPCHLRPSSSTLSGHCEAPRVFSQCLPRALERAANRKSEAQAQRVARVRVKQGAPPVALPNPSQAPDSALMVVQALPNIPRPGARSGWSGASDTWGQGLAWNSNAGGRQGQVAAGVGDRSGRGQEEGARTPPLDPGVWEESGGNRGPPLGLLSASKLGASARAQPGSQGPEGGRGQGCATGGDTGTLIC